MKKLLYIPSLFRRVMDNTATDKEQIIVFLIMFIPFILYVFIAGHPGHSPSYYYSK